MSYNFFALLSRMKYITRWALMRNIRPENLCEHTQDVAVLAHGLAVLQNRRFGGSLDVGKCVLLALYHDAPEILTGDLPTPVKYYNPAIRDGLPACRGCLRQQTAFHAAGGYSFGLPGFFLSRRGSGRRAADRQSGGQAVRSDQMCGGAGTGKSGV